MSEVAVIIDEMEYVKRQPRNDEPELHEYKSYPTLSIIAQLVKFLGWLSIVVGIFLFFICIINVAPGIRRMLSDVISGNESIFIAYLLGLFVVAPSYIFIGLLLIAGGENIQLFIDLQENADRQSILLSLLYHQAKAKGKIT